MELKETLGSSKKLCDIIDPICSKVEQLGAPVPKEEIIEILRRTATTEAGVSFPHFMLALGSPKLAREKGVFQGTRQFNHYIYIVLNLITLIQIPFLSSKKIVQKGTMLMLRGKKGKSRISEPKKKFWIDYISHTSMKLTLGL
jgi:hypothetical protein